MKINKLYSTDSRFETIFFNTVNINAILAIGDKPHSIGKTTLFNLLNYCLLKDDKPSFLKQRVFSEFTFFLELELSENNFLTIKRSVGGRANTGIKLHTNSEDYTELKMEDL